MNRITVLLASSNLPRREALRAELNRTTDFLVVGEADSGREALELVRSRRPRLLFIDVALPDMDGLSVLRRIKEQGIEKPITIMAAGYAGSYQCKAAHELGVEMCLQHPISEMSTINHMRTLLCAASAIPMRRRWSRQIRQMQQMPERHGFSSAIDA